jgi:hypothetical protein
MNRLRLAVVPTTGRGILWDCLDAIRPQVDHVILVTHRCAPRGLDEPWRITTLPYQKKVPNISEMWNLGLDEAEVMCRSRFFDVAVLNDDAIVPTGWFEDVVNAMREVGAVAGSRDQTGVLRGVHTYLTPQPISPEFRMSGYAFILDGESRLRADEQFQWWYGDDDLEWRARESGGVVKVPGPPVDHRYPNGTTVGELAEIAAQDRERFYIKWGRTPH